MHGHMNVKQKFVKSILYFRKAWVFRCIHKFQKVTIRFVTPACLSVWIEQLGSHWKDFHEISKFEYFSKICQENSSLILIWQE